MQFEAGVARDRLSPVRDSQTPAAAGLVAWITFWAFDSRARLQATHSPQPAPLTDASHAAHFGLTEAELAVARLAKVQILEIDPAGKVSL